MKHKSKKILSLLLAVLMLVGLAVPTGILTQPAKAKAGDTPAHSKTVTSNGDGTYTIELTVTGEAESETTVTGAVNVIVVIDTSISMTSNDVTYNNASVRRADAAEKVVYDFAHGLFGYTAKGADVQMAMVTFNRNASVVQGWTSTESDITGKLSPDGTNGSRKLTYSNGTNWEAALQALTREDEDNPGLLRTADKDNTFVIFVTDGAPSLYVGSNFNGSGYADTDNERLACYNNSKDEAYTIQQFQTNDATEKNTTLYAIYAFGDEADLLDDLIYFSNNNADRPEADGGVTGSTVATEGYFSAGSTDELQKAIAKIFKDIADFMGIAAVSIDDGTTSDVAVEGGEVVDLLEIDEDSYQYWLTVPLDSSMQFTRVNSDAQTITYTVTEDEETEGKYKISWGSGDNAKSVTVEGSITSTGDLRYEWKGSDDLYAKAPPEAKLVGSSVKWDLNSVGTLLTGVTYSVTFEVYPSQTTLDILADMKNDPYVDAEHTGAWGKLPAEVQKYIDKESGALTTNTGAKLTYTDTRLEDPKPTTSDFNKVDGVESKAVEQLAIAKEWKNVLDSQTSEPITFDVLRDGTKQYEVTLSDDNDWAGSVFVSIGIINKRGKVVKGSEGHDFTFKEPEKVSYHWELSIPTVHPMMIQGEPTVLIKVDDKHPLPEGATTYTIKGATYYVDDSMDAASLTAVNERRSYLDITKVVDGDDADPEQVFPFNVTIVNPKAPETEPTNDPKHESDYWVWFSIWNSGLQDRVDPELVSDEGPVYKEMDNNSEWTGYYYTKSGTTVTINLLAGDGLRFLNLPSGTTYTISETLPANYTFTSSELEATTEEPELDDEGNVVTDDDGNPVMNEIVMTGTDADDTFKGNQTTSGTIQEPNTDYTVTYTNTYNLSDIEITKVWEDNSNQDGKRPTAVEFKADLVLKADGTDVTSANASQLTVTDNEDNTYTVKWTGLDRYADGKEIKYTVEESAIDGYDTEGSPAEDGGTITNSHTPEVTDVTVTKVWDDDSDRDKVRPETLTLTLNGVPEGYEVPEPKIEKDGDSWTYTWSGLPLNDNGTAIKYTITEGTVPDKYTCEETTVASGGTITNKHEIETTDVTVTKEWDDDSDRDGIRPETLTLTLNGVPEGYEAPEPTVSKDGDKWTYTWKGVPKNADGEEIKYTITEKTVPDGYECETKTVDAGGTITNKHTIGETTATVTKVWDDDSDRDKVRPETLTLTLNGVPEGYEVPEPKIEKDGDSWTYTWSGLPLNDNGTAIKYTITEGTVPDKYTCEETTVASGGTITNKHEIETTDVTVTKVWDDDSNRDNLRPDDLTLTLNDVPEGYEAPEPTVSKDGDKWTYTWKGVPKNADGEEIKYTITEKTVPDGYECETKTVDAGGTITNKHTVGETTATVTKVWDDDSDRDGIRPDELTLTLNGVPDGYEAPEPKIEKDGDSWTYTWSGLPLNDNGTAIKYTITEGTVPDKYTCEETTVASGGTITNKHEIETTDVTVTKEWDDASNQDGNRPDELTLTLSGVPEGYEAPEPKIEKDGDSWTYTWEGVPKNDGGKEIEYTISEDEVPEGYTCEETTAANGGTITNSYEPEEDVIKVTKVWDDDSDRDGKRPDSLTLTLNGVPEGYKVPEPKVVKKGDKWTYTWEGLPKNDGGKEIKYTITEGTVPDGYTCEKTTVKAGGTITNTHEIEVTTITVTKVWDDASNQDGNRPDSLTLTLNGVPEGYEAPEPTVSKDGDKWTYTWEGLPKNDGGKEIEYTVSEDEIPDDYTCEEATAANGGTITNSYKPGMQTLTVKKVWSDSNDQDGLRPDEITVKLLLEGKECEKVTLDESNGWKYSWDLPKKADGKDLIYTVDEDVVPDGYEKMISGSAEKGFIITNVHKITPPPPPPTDIRIEIIKVWEDNNNASGIRTDTVEVTLMVGDVKNLTRNLGDPNDWKYECYMPGGYDYRVVETPVEGYDSIVTQSPIPGGIRFTVTNKLTKTPDLNTKDHVAYIVGYPDGTVRPDRQITRAEVATIFFRLLTDEARDKFWSQTNPYPDVKADDWFNNAISTLTKMGIINGYEDGTFRPNNPITRAELTKMAVSFFSSADKFFGKTPSFSDVPADAWYTRFIAAAEELGLINGYPDGTFRPNNYITRAETCTIVNRTLGRGPHKDHLLPEEVMINWPDNLPTQWYYEQIQEATNSHDYEWITEIIEKTTVEQWLAKLPERDWVALEQIWSTAHSAPGGEVMG